MVDAPAGSGRPIVRDLLTVERGRNVIESRDLTLMASLN